MMDPQRQPQQNRNKRFTTKVAKSTKLRNPNESISKAFVSVACGEVVEPCALSKIGSSPCRYSILLQCHSEEPFGHAQDKLRDEESVCSRFRGVKNIKQILHFVQDDNLVN